MEIDQKKLVELFAALSFIILLLLVVLIVTKPAGSEITTTQVVITNSFNNYVDDFNRDNNYDHHNNQYDNRYDRNIDYRERSLRFDDRGTYRVRENMFGQSFNEYVVYVENEDYVGGYFSVEFYFYDYYGHEERESITKYIGPRHEVAFVYRDVDYSSNVYDWNYKVISESDVRVN
jgi:hypothetical protein